MTEAVATGMTLTEFAAAAVGRIAEHFPDADLLQQQVLCLAEETGEFVGAYRRWAGMARRSGSWDDVKAELADVVLTAYVTAEVFGIDLEDDLRPAKDHFSYREEPHLRVLLLHDHAGRFTSAYLRSITGGWSDVPAELAGVVGVAYAVADVLGIDLDAAWREKAAVITSRGWRDPSPEASR